MTSDSSVDDSPAEAKRLPPAATVDDLEEDTPYVATINGIVDYGIFVDLNDSVSGLIHESNLEGTYAVGDELVVELDRIRDDRDVSFIPRPELTPPPKAEEPAADEPNDVTAGALEEYIGSTVNLTGEVTQIKQTTGPTLFLLTTGDGIATAAAFEGAGVRAYPDVEIGDVVHVRGTIQYYDGSIQLEADQLSILAESEAETARADIDTRLAEAAAPADLEPLVDWSPIHTLWPELEAVARQVREALLTGRPVRIRHHADVDGICASVPMQAAIETFVEDHHADPEAANYLTRRLPSKAPFYEMADATRDLNRALEEQDRHGQQLPVVIMLDNGSTAEDAPAFETLSNYGMSIITIDHHVPDEEVVDDFLDAHINPYLIGEDYRVTTAMLAVEVARLIAPELSEEFEHLPAIAGVADRSESEAMDEYLALAGGELTEVRKITEAVDYAAHWLGYDTGRHLMKDLLDVECDDRQRHERLVGLFARRAEVEVDRQLEAAEPYLEHQELPNDADLYTLDLEEYAYRHIYPAPGKTTTAIHDSRVEEHPDRPIITIGYGDDYAVLRSDGVRLDIPEIVTDLTESIRGGGVSGGGHLVVGSIRFVGGRREEVLDSLIDRLGEAPLDESAVPERITEEHA